MACFLSFHNQYLSIRKHLMFKSFEKVFYPVYNNMLGITGTRISNLSNNPNMHLKVKTRCLLFPVKVQSYSAILQFVVTLAYLLPKYFTNAYIILPKQQILATYCPAVKFGLLWSLYDWPISFKSYYVSARLSCYGGICGSRMPSSGLIKVLAEMSLL